MRLPNAVRTAAFRLTALYAALFALSLAIILAMIITLVQRSMLDQVGAAARDDAALLARTYQRTEARGFEGLHRSRGGGQSYSFIRRADGTEAIAEFRPPGMPVGAFTTDFTGARGSRGDEIDGALIGYGVLLADGTYIAAARDDDPVHETMEAVVEAATAAAMVALTLAVLGGLLMSTLSLRRVDSLDRTARAIFDGDLNRRMPVRGTGDEFDRLAASLNRMLDRMSTLMEGLRQVSTDVAHDLRTPLARLRQRLEDFDRSELTAEQRRSLSSAVAEVDAILEIFAGLIQIAQVEAGSIRRRFTDVDLGAVAAEVGEIYHVIAEGAGHSLDVSVDDDAVVKGNRQLLVQLIVNLIENAINHSPAGTAITLSVADRAGQAVLTVADNGPGIPLDERNRVFKRFYRLDRSRSTPGTGLGLTLVAAIAELHATEIVLSDNMPGSRFTLTFPTPDGMSPKKLYAETGVRSSPQPASRN